MFTVHCPRHGTEVLLSESRIRGLDPAADGRMTLRWECWCGHRGAHRTGRARPRTDLV